MNIPSYRKQKSSFAFLRHKINQIFSYIFTLDLKNSDWVYCLTEPGFLIHKQTFKSFQSFHLNMCIPNKKRKYRNEMASCYYMNIPFITESKSQAFSKYKQ